MKKQVIISESRSPTVQSLGEAPKAEAENPRMDKKIIKMRNIIDEDTEKKSYQENENLDQLDQWKEQLNTKKKVFIFDKTGENQAKSLDFNLDNETGPQLNQEIINQIARIDPRKKAIKRESQQSDQPADNVNVKFQMLRKSGSENTHFKTLEQVRLDMNKKLLNTLLLDKVQRRVDKVQKGQQWNINQVEEGTTQIFSEQAKIIKMTTLNNFKGLNEYFKNPAQFIDYEDVLAKAKHYSNKPSPFSQKDNYIQNGQGFSTKSLMESYQGLQSQITDHKQILYGLRVDNNNLVHNMQKIEDDIIHLKRKFYAREERTRQGMVDQTNLLSMSPGKRVTRNNVMDVLERLKLQREQEEQMLHLNISQIKSQMFQNTEKQNLIQKELDELREKKRRCKMILKDAFLKQIQRSQNQLCTESLIQVVKQLRRINELPKQDTFPNYLDEQSVSYIFKVAALEQQVEEVRIQTQNGQNTINQNHLEAITSKYGSIAEIKEKVKAHLYQNKYTIQKNAMHNQLTMPTEGDATTADSRFNRGELTFKLTKINGEPISFNNQNKDLNQKLLFLQQQLEQIGIQEQARLFKIYMVKRSQNDINELKYILAALFGANQSEHIWQNFMNQWCETYNLNPQRIVPNQVDSQAQVLSISKDVQLRAVKTMKNLVTEQSVNYDFDLLTLNSKPATANGARKLSRMR